MATVTVLGDFSRRPATINAAGYGNIKRAAGSTAGAQYRPTRFINLTHQCFGPHGARQAAIHPRFRPLSRQRGDKESRN